MAQQPTSTSSLPDSKKSMTETAVPVPTSSRRRRCLIVGGAVLLLLLLIFIVALILALTVFKAKEPTTQVLSASLDGVSPRISFPIIKIELNITLDLKLRVKNPNPASFRHGAGKSFLIYRGNQVGEADLYPGYIPSKGSETLPCRLTMEVDQMASSITSLISDVTAGHLAIESRTRIPGRVNFLGIFKKHAVATSKCQFSIAIPAMQIQSQKCKIKTKF